MARLLRSAFATVAALGLLAACGSDSGSTTLSGYQLEPAPSVGALSLPDAATAAPFKFVAAKDKLLVVYFGYTSCPDVCPTTLATLRRSFEDIGAAAEKVDLAMVTIDPVRDTTEVITGYVQSFIARAHGLRTESDTDLRDVAKAFGASYTVKIASDGTEEVSHSGAMYVVDDTGAIVLVWPFGLQPPAISTDLKILLKEYTA